jgi:hypothetical protein
MDLLRGYRPAMEILGEPIEVTKIDKDEKFYKLEERFASAKMIIEGAHRQADLFVQASRKETQRDWQVDSLEIKYRGSPMKPIKFYGIKEK